MLPPSRSGSIAAGDAVLYTREIVAAPPWRMTTGGPDFDHGYLLPELGHLAGRFRAICYDQRGRSAAGIRADDVSMATEIDDLDRLRVQFGFDTMAVLGHPWGGVLAMAYALRHPDRLSRLILMNSAPASHAGWLARPIEDRLMRETADSPGFDLIPSLRGLDIPALVLHGERDFIPVAIAARIAVELPRGHLEVLPGCGHFMHLECPTVTIGTIARFPGERAGR